MQQGEGSCHTSVPGAVAPTGFSSFPAQAFFSTQEGEEKQRHQKLLEAAKAHLSSSSDESSSSSGKEESRGKRKRAERHGKARSSKKRRKKDEGSPGKHKKRKHKQSDLEKILAKEQQAAQAAMAGRGGLRPGVQAPAAQWADRQAMSKSALGASYFDTKGDVQNLAYMGLYGGNIASYHRCDPLGLARPRPGQFDSLRDSEKQSASSGSRFFHAANVMLERSRRLRRLRPLVGRQMQRGLVGSEARGAGGAAWPSLRRSMPLPSFIPLQEGRGGHVGPQMLQQSASGLPVAVASGTQAEDEGEAFGGETVEECVLRQIRDLNAATRDKPQDVGQWLRYVAFQDEAFQLLGKGGRRGRANAANAVAVAEKKIAILGKALEYHPGNTQLLLAMLEAYSSMVDAEGLCKRWEQVIRSAQLRAAPKTSLALWTAYLRLRRTLFMTFKMQSLQATYSEALPAIAMAWTRAQHAGGCSPEEVLALQVGAVRCALDLTELELQGGHHELVVSRVQALTEFYCFAPLGGASAHGGGGGPSQPYSHGAQLRMFEAFWESPSARAGEEGARGWAAWFRRENRDLLLGPGGKGRQSEAAEEEDAVEGESAQGQGAAAEAGGGWTGWVELPKPPSPSTAQAGPQVPGREGEGEERAAIDSEAGASKGQRGEGEEGEEQQEVEEEEEGEEGINEEELMAQLGLRLDKELEELKTQGVQPHVLRVWVAEELQRSRNMWAPVRLHGDQRQASTAVGGRPADSAGTAGEEGEGGAGAVEEPDLLRVVELDDIRPALLPIRDPGVRDLYVLGCLSLLGAPLGDSWCSSNQPLLLHEDALPPDLLQQLQLRRTAEGLGPGGAVGDCLSFAVLSPVLAPTPWYAEVESRRAFMARLLQLLISPGAPYHEHPDVSLAYLVVEATGPVKAEGRPAGQQGGEQDSPGSGQQAPKEDAKPVDVTTSQGQQGDGHGAGDATLHERQQGQGTGGAYVGQAGQQSEEGGVYSRQRVQLSEVERARGAAKQLLARQRGNLVLWGALAEVEMLAGNIKGARHVVGTTLSVVATFPEPSRRQHLGPLLVSHILAELAHAKAEAEVATAWRRAFHMLVWFLAGSGTGITSYKPLPAASAASATPGGLQEQLAVAHRGLALVLPHVAAASVQAQFSRADASVVLAAALLEVSAAHVLPHSGCNLHSALAVFKNTAVAGTEPAARKACRNHEWLQAKLCHLVVKETASPEPAMTPAQVREFVLQALSMYPRNLSLLQLLEVLESRAHAYVRLQQFMRTAVDAHPSTHLLAHALTSEVQRQRCSSIVSLGGGESVWLGGRPPAVRLRPLLERAAATQQLATSPQLWLMYLRYEVQQGQPDAVRRVFLRGVRQCPGCKALWLEGLLYAAATPSPALSAGGTAAGAPSTAGLLPPRQAAELLEVMGDKGVRVRTDVMEAVMQALDEQPLLL